MALVDYSDSDESDSNQAKPRAAEKPSQSTNQPAKAAFQKRVDRSNPGKIKVTLPTTATADPATDGPPTKRAKTKTSTAGGGGAFSGFSSFLPAPKNRLATSQARNGNVANGSTGLRPGVSLKTGAAPGFSREVEVDETTEQNGRDTIEGNVDGHEEKVLSASGAIANEGTKVTMVGKSTMFKPLSVARKSVKSKSSMVAKKETPTTPQPLAKMNDQDAQRKAKPKISLFSIGDQNGGLAPSQEHLEDAKSPFYEHPNDLLEPSYEDYTPNTSFTSTSYYDTSAIPPAVPTPPSLSQTSTFDSPAQPSQTLSSIADDLKLTPSDRRRLLGRRGHQQPTHAFSTNLATSSASPSTTKIITYSTTTEYAHNEMLRQAAAEQDQPSHRPVRSIAPGKHSLSQLVGNAQMQRAALEESFAEGKGRRKEAGGRYGWG